MANSTFRNAMRTVIFGGVAAIGTLFAANGNAIAQSRHTGQTTISQSFTAATHDLNTGSHFQADGANFAGFLPGGGGVRQFGAGSTGDVNDGATGLLNFSNSTGPSGGGRGLPGSTPIDQYLGGAFGNVNGAGAVGFNGANFAGYLPGGGSVRQNIAGSVGQLNNGSTAYFQFSNSTGPAASMGFGPK